MKVIWLIRVVEVIRVIRVVKVIRVIRFIRVVRDRCLCIHSQSVFPAVCET